METKLTREDYDSLEMYIQVEILDFCGCGQPATVLKYLLEVLRGFKRTADLDSDSSEWDKAWKERTDFFKSLGEEYLVYYFLAQKDFTEHGGSVPGWLTEKGEELLELLEKWNSEENGK